MDGERDKILKMLEEGTISAEEAEELLAAIDDSTAVEASYEELEPPQFPKLAGPVRRLIVCLSIGRIQALAHPWCNRSSPPVQPFVFLAGYNPRWADGRNHLFVERWAMAPYARKVLRWRPFCPEPALSLTSAARWSAPGDHADRR